MRDDLERQITRFLNWWDDHLEETRFPEGEQEDDVGECVYPVTYQADQRALVAQLCEAGCCTSAFELDDLVVALRELMGRQAPEPLPPDNDRLFRLSEDDHKVWEAEFAKANPDAFHEDARGPGDWERIKAEQLGPPPGARRAGELPPEDSPFWAELLGHLTNRERLVLWNVLRMSMPGAPARMEVKQSQLTAELEHYMSRHTCERAIRMLRRRGLLWIQSQRGEGCLQMTASGTIVANQMFPK